MQSSHCMMTHYWLVNGHGCKLPIIATLVFNVSAVTFSLGHFDPLTMYTQPARSDAIYMYTGLGVCSTLCHSQVAVLKATVYGVATPQSKQKSTN